MTASVWPAASAATFAPIAGALSIKAGDRPAKSTPAIIGAANLSESSFPQGFDFASSSLVAAIPNPNRFTFSSAASSSTNVAAPAGQTRATASMTFHQSFTTSQPHWLELQGEVLSPPAQHNVFATLTLTRVGQPAPVFTLGDTAGMKVTRGAVVPTGTFTLFASIDTTAPTPGSFAGALAGHVLMARLGDFNGDAFVNDGDLPTWKTGFGSETGAFAAGNLNDDSLTDGADFLLWQRQFGARASVAANVAGVPEPAATALLGSAAWCALIAGCRRSRR